MIDKSILALHPKAVTDVVRFLDSSHLPNHIRQVVIPFEDLAAEILRDIPPSPELTKTVQKLVETKDQAVRAYLHAQENNLVHILPGNHT